MAKLCNLQQGDSLPHVCQLTSYGPSREETGCAMSGSRSLQELTIDYATEAANPMALPSLAIDDDKNTTWIFIVRFEV